MGLLNWLGSFLRSSIPTEPSRRLDGRSEPLLKASMKLLVHGERGWITMNEAGLLFSSASASYAFGEMDEAGQHNLATFATKMDCDVEFLPLKGRVYFTRQRAKEADSN